LALLGRPTPPPLTIYHAGDTLVTQNLIAALKNLAPLHIAIVPINGSDWERTQAHLAGNMHSEDAAKFVRAIGADLSIPAHYDMMSDNAANPAFFAEAMRRLCPAKKYHIFALGERFVYRAV
jgi:L-ascorbate metabolism protein UlaG (beta-lactamase superfamily)